MKSEDFGTKSLTLEKMLFLFAILRAKVSSLVKKKQLGKSSLGHSLFYELRTLTRHPTVWKERLWWPWSNRTFSNRLVSLKTSEILFPVVLRSARKEPYPHKDTCLWQKKKSWQEPQQNKLPKTSPPLLDLSLYDGKWTEVDCLGCGNWRFAFVHHVISFNWCPVYHGQMKKNSKKEERINPKIYLNDLICR